MCYQAGAIALGEDHGKGMGAGIGRRLQAIIIKSPPCGYIAFIGEIKDIEQVGACRVQGIKIMITEQAVLANGSTGTIFITPAIDRIGHISPGNVRTVVPANCRGVTNIYPQYHGFRNDLIIDGHSFNTVCIVNSYNGQVFDINAV